MRCILCGRRADPVHEGWVTLLTHRAERPDARSSYCPECFKAILDGTATFTRAQQGDA